MARVDIARPDNAAPDQTEVYNLMMMMMMMTIFMLHGILYERHLSLCNNLLRDLCVLVHTVLVLYDVFTARC